ncbi:MAG: hypothetical protein CTY33_00375 [Methylotenera sp.]|nr:MAG: hypothetical protein CTY33_00375 [Methylotenera sp.]
MDIQPPKTPFNYEFITYLWVVGLSAWGGVVSFMAKRKQGVARPFNFMELIGEIVTSAFAGMMTFWLAELANFPPLLTAALVGISGHMGSRSIGLLENYFTKKFNPEN